MSTAPLVTIALPLCRSGRFRDNVAANLGRLDDSRFEIIVSDRHREDDTLEWLSRRFGGDPRFTFIGAADRLDWVAHFNSLLRRAHGEYFCWMAHDDAFPAGYVLALVEALRHAPDASIAFGQVRPELEPGRAAPADRWLSPPPCVSPPRTAREARKLLGTGNLALAFHGVFRRAPVVERGLWIRHTHRCVNADYYWMFALAQLGRFEYVPSVGYQKRYHAQSFHARARITAATVLSGLAAMSAYVWQLHGAAPPAARVLGAGLAWAAHQLAAVARRRARQRARALHAAASRRMPGARLPGRR